MNRRERFTAALGGAAVDRPPCTAWIHFATDALSPEETARRHQLFMQTYGWDFCKLMNDYRFPLPRACSRSSRWRRCAASRGCR